MNRPAAPLRAGRFHYGVAIAFLAGLSMFASFGLGRFAYGLLLPSMKGTLGLTYTESSWLAFANLGAYIIAAPIAGVLSARHGPRLVISLSLIELALSLWGLSWAPGFWPAFVCFGLAGLGSGLVAIPALGIISAWYAPRRRGLGMGLTLIATPASLIFTGAFVPFVIALHPETGWREAWLAFAGITLAIGAIVLLALRNRPAQIGLQPIGGAIPIAAGPRPGIRSVLGIRSLWLLTLAYACFGFAYVIYATFLPTFVQQERGLDPASGGQIWQIIGLGGLVGPTLFGWLSDRIGRRHGLAILFCLLAASIVTAVWLPIDVARWLSPVLYGLTGGSIVGVVAAASGDYAGPTLAAAALGLASMFLGVGQTIGPLVAGPIADRTGSFEVSLLSSAGVAIVGAVVALGLPRPPGGRRAIPASPPSTAPAPVARPPTTSAPAPVTAAAWRTWAIATADAEARLAREVAEWAARTADPGLAEVFRLVAGRARDHAYQLRRAAGAAGGRPGSATPAESTGSTGPAGTDDPDYLDRLIDWGDPFAGAPPSAPDSTEARLIERLRRSAASTLALLREERARQRAIADRTRVRVADGVPVEAIGGDVAFCQPIGDAVAGGWRLARIQQRPGTLLRLPPADRLIVWQDGTGAIRPVDCDPIPLTPGEIVGVQPGGPIEILVTGDWPARYLLISGEPVVN